MRRLSRLVLAASLVAGAVATAAPAQADECIVKACYQCVMHPCGPGDWIEYLAGGGTGGVVSVEFQEMVVCVTEPCYQPMPVVVCVAYEAVCTPR